eukprot:scaffold51125_cov32-Tisochrysis_lutea.AAC.3
MGRRLAPSLSGSNSPPGGLIGHPHAHALAHGPWPRHGPSKPPKPRQHSRHTGASTLQHDESSTTCLGLGGEEKRSKMKPDCTQERVKGLAGDYKLTPFSVQCLARRAHGLGQEKG